ncbi:hypothetical protein [Streptomyces odonnellii]|uniref:hypothetical protein n=1 Tax=Streptomyces odonnellii TaxID=1417980 RepID=UPI0012FF1001|nr:hypothetical protein [Streptomyces odonnellii]
MPVVQFLLGNAPFERHCTTQQWAKLHEDVDDAVEIVAEIAVDQGAAYSGPRKKQRVA